MDLRTLTRRAVPLSPDNFTPRSRTPWGGTYIGKVLKDLVCPESAGAVIGESWEFSCEPSYPSFIAGTKLSLADLVAQEPEGCLSPALAAKRDNPSCEILVKIVDAQDNLSLQVHPHDDDPFLKADECGKPESWFVLAVEKNAGVYLGFRQAMSKDRLRSLLQTGESLEPYLQFVPLKPGDYLEIPAGICHAIGKGVTLIEPQRILPGRKGKTYRIWDWGRTYNDRGELDPRGKPRDLHIEESLALVDPSTQWGKGLLDALYSPPTVQEGRGFTVRSFGTNPHYRSHFVRLGENARMELNVTGGYAALLTLGGKLDLASSSRAETPLQKGSLSKGQAALLPHKAFPFSMHAASDAQLFLVVPKDASCHFTQGNR